MTDLFNILENATLIDPRAFIIGCTAIRGG